MTSKPIFVLLHGAWHTPHCWTRLTPLLASHGYESVCPHLPSSIVESNPPTPDWEPDIEAIRSTITPLVRDQGRDAIVVMHSNAGLTGGTALEGLDKASCAAKGWKGCVVRLVYICGFIEMRVDFTSQTITVRPEDVKGLMYQDLSDEEAAEVAKTLVPQSLGPFSCTTTYAAWRWIPTTYVITLGDKESTVQAAEWLVKSAMESSPTRVEKVIRREVGHASFWSQPEWTAEMLILEAGGV